MSDPVLYFRPGACALAPHIALHWSALPHQARLGKRDDADFLAVSPNAVVPVLVTDDGAVLSQAGAVLNHIARRAGRQDLLGDTDRDQDQVAMWTAFFGADFHPAFWPIFVPQRFTVAESDDAKAAVRAAGVAQVKALLSKLDAHLQDRTFFVGARKTIVDAYAIPMLRWANNIEELGLDAHPAVRRYYQTITADPGVVAAMKVQDIQP